MKNILAVIAILSLVAFSLAAGVDKGRIELGGMAGFEMYMDASEIDGVDDVTYTTIGLAPQGAYYVINGLSVGAEILFARMSSDAEGSGVNTMWGIGPVVGYYINIGKDNMFPFVRAGVAYMSDTYTPDEGDATTFNTLDIPLGAGLRLMLNDNFALDVGVSFTIHSETLKDAPDGVDPDKANVLALEVGFSGFLK